MRALLLIGAGGFFGSVFRYLLTKFIHTKVLTSFPIGTLAVNLIGCFALGLLISVVEKTHPSSDRQLFLTTGLCGGFTTFSAFSSETLGMLRGGQLWQAGVYIVVSVAVGVLATLLGYSIKLTG